MFALWTARFALLIRIVDVHSSYCGVAQTGRPVMQDPEMQPGSERLDQETGSGWLAKYCEVGGGVN
jgi:hypothetical protein